LTMAKKDYLVLDPIDKQLKTATGKVWNFIARNWPTIAFEDLEKVVQEIITEEKNRKSIKKVVQVIDLEFEVDKTYRTKFQTGEMFTIKKIVTKPFLKDYTKIIRFEGIYEKAPHLGLCPIDPERLHPEKKTVIVEIEE
jgi:hypothetical protein